jgi:hypothetical protein
LLKAFSWSLIKKVPDARRAKNPRAEAYSDSTLERILSERDHIPRFERDYLKRLPVAGYWQMGLFHQAP